MLTRRNIYVLPGFNVFNRSKMSVGKLSICFNSYKNDSSIPNVSFETLIPTEKEDIHFDYGNRFFLIFSSVDINKSDFYEYLTTRSIYMKK